MINKSSSRKRFNQAAATYNEFAAVQNYASGQMMERLSLFKIKPQRLLDLGSGTGTGARKLAKFYRRARVVQLDFAINMLQESKKAESFWSYQQQHVCADAERLPFSENSLDMVFAAMSIQWSDDLPILLNEICRCLKPGGLFLFSTLGMESFKELRHAWSVVDQHEHVNNFHTIPALGEALINSGFQQPVLDRELLMTYYTSPKKLFQALKGLGVTNSLATQRKSLTGKNRFQSFLAELEAARKVEGLPVSYELIFAHAWAGDKVAPKKVDEVRVGVDKIFYRDLGR